MIESILIDRLIAQVERRAKCEKDYDAIERECAAAKALLAGLKDECARLRQTRDRLIDESNDLRRQRTEAEPRLRELWDAADAVASAPTAGHRAERVKRLCEALQAAHGDCSVVPF